MRPEILNPLFVEVTRLPGVGPRLGGLLRRLAGPGLVDLAWHLPSGLVDRRYRPALATAEPGRVATLMVTIDRHQPPPSHNTRLPWRVWCSDGTGQLVLVYFHARPHYLATLLPPGETRLVGGRLERYGDCLQIVHPDFVAAPAELGKVAVVQPVYPMAAGLTARTMAKTMAAMLQRLPDLPEWLPPGRPADWPAWAAAVRQVHTPAEPADLLPDSPARRRLACDELLASQLAVALVRARLRQRGGRSVTGDGRLADKICAALPFTLTGSQQAALADIRADMAANRQMLRLLQGDVGSGKTIVALLAMAGAIEAGAQAALMAPTALLARQHLASLQALAPDIRMALLTGGARSASRRQALADTASGAARLVIGTHALFQENVRFHDLACAVIDEQHRFGVHQRAMLTAKGQAVDLLVMTATPIPRTLLLAAYGDIDETRITGKPAGRRRIDTRAIPLERLEDVVAATGRAVAAGARVYWICPLVAEAGAGGAAATDRHAALRAIFGQQAGLLHGQMRPAEKDAAMADFIAGRSRILVATTVVEVGVDVPEATLIVIEHAERFGLAQLHQLRGRVGRGNAASTCLLLYQSPLSAPARARLSLLRETEDGFRLADEDLRLRGGGEILGTRQSGLPGFRIADLVRHQDLLAMARDDARATIAADPHLTGQRGAALRLLLYLFRRDAVVHTPGAG